MGIANILASLDRDIALLKQARALLGGGATGSGKKAGRPATLAGNEITARPAKRKKRNLTPEGRKRIADAQKRRWEAQKKASATPVQK